MSFHSTFRSKIFNHLDSFGDDRRTPFRLLSDSFDDLKSLKILILHPYPFEMSSDVWPYTFLR